MKKFLSMVIIFLVFVILGRLPVVPISVAPVVLNATYSFRMKTLQEILWFVLNRPDGISYQWYWYTYAVILVLLAIGCLISVLVFRKIGASSNN
jgi:hypothetical protein